MQKYKLIAKVSLIALLVIGIIMAVLFYVGGNLAETHIVAGDELAIPRFTDLFLISVELRRVYIAVAGIKGIYNSLNSAIFC